MNVGEFVKVAIKHLAIAIGATSKEHRARLDGRGAQTKF